MKEAQPSVSIRSKVRSGTRVVNNHNTVPLVTCRSRPTKVKDSTASIPPLCNKRRFKIIIQDFEFGEQYELRSLTFSGGTAGALGSKESAAVHNKQSSVSILRSSLLAQANGAEGHHTQLNSLHTCAYHYPSAMLPHDPSPALTPFSTSTCLAGQFTTDRQERAMMGTIRSSRGSLAT
jgi:hypothetical protein